MHWLIEKNTFGQQCFDQLIEVLLFHGYNYKTVDYRAFIGIDPKLFDEDACVITYGSIDLCKAVQKLPWYPGVFCTFPNYQCTEYYPVLGRWLLNSPYVMLPYGELNRNESFLKSLFGDEFFVRPNSGDKCFSGQVIGGDYAASVQRLGFYDASPSALVVAAAPQTIRREWRLVVSREIIAASQYMEDGRHFESEGCPSEVQDFANEILQSGFRPDPVWTMDICQVGNDLRLLEIGSFSAAGLYACNMRNVVEKVSRVAYEEWLELR